MPAGSPSSIFDAFLEAQRRGVLPTHLDTAGLRELAAETRGLAFFSARATSAIFVSRIKEVVEAVMADEMDEASARLALLETLRAIGYTPEGGFPDAPPGAVPPAIRGTLQDLSSFRRLNLIVRTLVDLMAGAGQQARGHDRIAEFPAWELVRLVEKTDKRDWYARWVVAGGPVEAVEDPKASDVVGAETGMIALKGDPRWGELGSSDNFPDALDVDHPPWAFGSGVGWREVPLGRVVALGITGPNGESLNEWFATQPRVIRGKLPMAQIPNPPISLKGVDADIVKQFTEDTGATMVDDQATRNDEGASRAERRAARLRKAREQHAAATAGGGA